MDAMQGGALVEEVADGPVLSLLVAPEADCGNRSRWSRSVRYAPLIGCGWQGECEARSYTGRIHRVLPPIVVHRKTMRVIDGLCRLAAARLRGRRGIEVVFATGGELDLFVLAVHANRGQGLPLTQADRNHAAARIVASHPRRSDRRITSVAGLSPSIVGSIRNRSTAGSGHSNARRGRDGIDRPLGTAEGRRLAGDLLRARPDAPIREIAAAVGIAPSTVHDVRQRLRAGKDLVPPSQCNEGGEPRRPCGTPRQGGSCFDC